MKTRVSRWIFFLIITLGSLFLYLNTLDFPAGADVFPKFLTITLTVLAVIMVVKGIYEDKKAGRSQEEEKEGPEEVVADQEQSIFRKYQHYFIYGFIILLLFLIPRLGFFISTILFLPLVMYFLGIRKISTLLIPTIIFVLLVYLLFVTQLHVPLPDGILF